MPNPLRAIRPKDHTQLIRVSAVKTHKDADLTVGIQSFNPLPMIFKIDSLCSIAKRGVEKREKKSRNLKKLSTLLDFEFFLSCAREFKSVLICWVIVNIFSILFIIENSLLCILTFTFLHFIGFLQFFALLYPDFCFF